MRSEVRKQSDGGDWPTRYAAIGDKDAAFHWLTKAMEARLSLVLWMKDSPGFKPLRGDPRFAALIRQLKLPA